MLFRSFSYKNIITKILDSFQNFLKKPYYLIISSMAIIPFGFLIELLLIVVLISVNSPYILPIVLFMVALVEEFLKSIGIYTIYSRKLFKMNAKRSILLGFFTGIGFFIGEKAMLLITITSFIKEFGLILFAGLLVPLIVHTALGMMFSFLMYKLGKRYYFIILIFVSLIHFVMNWVVIKGVL